MICIVFIVISTQQFNTHVIVMLKYIILYTVYSYIINTYITTCRKVTLYYASTHAVILLYYNIILLLYIGSARTRTPLQHRYTTNRGIIAYIYYIPLS